MDTWVSWALLACGLTWLQSAVGWDWSHLKAQLGCMSKRARSWLAGGAGCHLGAQLGQSAGMYTLDLSVWLGLRTAWQLGSERVHPGSACSKRQKVEAAGPLKPGPGNRDTVTSAKCYWEGT